MSCFYKGFTGKAQGRVLPCLALSWSQATCFFYIHQDYLQMWIRALSQGLQMIIQVTNKYPSSGLKVAKQYDKLKDKNFQLLCSISKS